jgi:hypothetical protein
MTQITMSPMDRVRPGVVSRDAHRVLGTAFDESQARSVDAVKLAIQLPFGMARCQCTSKMCESCKQCVAIEHNFVPHNWREMVWLVVPLEPR